MSTRHALEIAADHPAFAGHFPGMPILPGAALLDEVLSIFERELGLDLTQWQLASAKFQKSVRPGEMLTVEHTRAAAGAIHFTVRSGADAALTGILSVAAT